MSETMWTDLEKVDVLRERMGVSYEQARLALEEAEGDLVKALADLEKEKDRDEIRDCRFMESLKDQCRRLNQTQLRVKHNDRTLLSLSAPLGIALGYTIWRRPTLRMIGLLGAVAAAFAHYGLEVDTLDEESEDFYPGEIRTVIIPEGE